jgi:hypothetical protein
VAIAVRGTPTSVGNATAATTLVVPVPAGIQDGDVLLAVVGAEADSNATISGVPSGWTLAGGVISTATSSTSQVRSAIYYHVVASAAGEPANYTWTLSASLRSAGGMVAYSGVDNATPQDVTASTLGQSSTGTSLAVPAVTTASANALLASSATID